MTPELMFINIAILARNIRLQAGIDAEKAK
jgi:hypothetical protein